MRKRVKLQAQLPDEFGALVDRDSVPKERVRVRFRFALALPKNPNFGPRPCGPPDFGVARHEKEYHLWHGFAGFTVASAYGRRGRGARIMPTIDAVGSVMPASSPRHPAQGLV
jgi:hypothetical protein